jgi:hypothetical protein
MGIARLDPKNPYSRSSRKESAKENRDRIARLAKIVISEEEFWMIDFSHPDRR